MAPLLDPHRTLEGNPSRLLGPWLAAATITAPEPEPADKVYLIKQVHDSYDGLPVQDGEGHIVRAFFDRCTAESYLSECVREQREQWLRRPFFDLPHLTSVPPLVFRDVVQDLGLEPPPASWAGLTSGWACWWAIKSPGMSDWQRQQFVVALDLLPSYRLVAVDLLE